MKVAPNMPPLQVYLNAINSLSASNSVGCVVISNAQNFATCMVYIYSGRIVGVYSFADGWLEPTAEPGRQCVQAIPGAKIIGQCLHRGKRKRSSGVDIQPDRTER